MKIYRAICNNANRNTRWGPAGENIEFEDFYTTLKAAKQQCQRHFMALSLQQRMSADGPAETLGRLRKIGNKTWSVGHGAQDYTIEEIEVHESAVENPRVPDDDEYFGDDDDD